MPDIEDIIDAMDPEDPTTEYIAFLLPPDPDIGEPQEPQIGVEYKDVFTYQNFHSISYSGLEWYGFYDQRSFGLHQDTENVFSPRPGMNVEQCLALMAADPYFTVVPTPPGNHNP